MLYTLTPFIIQIWKSFNCNFLFTMEIFKVIAVATTPIGGTTLYIN